MATSYCKTSENVNILWQRKLPEIKFSVHASWTSVKTMGNPATGEIESNRALIQCYEWTQIRKFYMELRQRDASLKHPENRSLTFIAHTFA